jgi:putative ABC transport system permease protein
MRTYRLLLLVYPRAFRHRYGAEMTEAFERLAERTRAERGRAGWALLWARTAADALVSGTSERLFGRTPEQGGEGKMGTMFFQAVQAIRRLRRAPAYTAAFVLTLGLAIGVNSAVFSVVNGVLLRPLPFQDGARILYLKQPVEGLSVENARFSFMEIDDYRAASRTIDEFVEFGDWEFTVVAEGAEPHRGVGGLVTSNYFGVLGMRPALGRLLDEQDDVRGAEPVMVMTDAYWERVFGRDLRVVGRVLDLENISPSNPFIPTRVVGVLQPGLHYTGSRRPDFYVNYAANGHYQDASMRDSRGHRMTDVFARMAPGVTLDVARGELGSIAQQLHREYPGDYPTELGYGLQVVPWEQELTREGRSTFLFLMGTVGIVLLLAAANVTNLTLTRLIRKETELSTRAALGASSTDLRLHLTAEHAMLGLAGGALGILLAYASRDSLVAYAGRFTVRAQEVGVDWTVLGATLGGGVLLACALAWMPGLPVAPGVGRVASAQSRATDTRWRKRLQRGLVVSQLALSFTLLTGTGLLVRSLIELTSVSPGFQTEEVLTMRTPTGPAGTPLPMGPDPGWQSAIDEIRAFPGVRTAAVASWAPLSATEPSAIGVRIDDEQAEDDRTHLAAANNVSAGYFELLGIPLVAGRYFDETDNAGARSVVILNESMARAHFGDSDPIGRRIAFTPDFQHVFALAWHEIVGVVADSKEYGMNREGVHTFYRPAARTAWGPAILVAHQGDPTQLTQHVRDVIRRMQPDRAIEEVQTLTSLVEQDLAPSRLNAMLFGSFAALALLIATLGVFSTLAFSVSQRVREFGVRMAIGADHGSVLRSVLGEGVVMVVVALGLGTAAALVLGRFLAGLLFQVAPVDPVSMLSAALVLGAVALGAAMLPALRATRIHPSEALKGE